MDKFENSWLLALERDDAKNLFAAKGNEALSSYLDQFISQPSNPDAKLELGQHWRDLNHVLSDQGSNDELSARSLALLNGRALFQGDERIVNLVRPDVVRHVAGALAQFSVNDAKSEADDVDIESIWPIVEKVTKFYEAAAERGAAVVFTAS